MGVAAITASPVVIAPATTGGITEIDPLTAGVTLVEALPPAGFSTPSSGQQKTVNVDAPDLRFELSSPRVERDLQTTLRLFLETTPPEPVEISIISSSDAVLTVASDGSVVGGGSLTLQAVPGNTTFTVWLQGQDLGSAQLTAQAAGYDDGIADVSVHPSGFVHASAFGLRVPLSTPPFEEGVLAAMLDRASMRKKEEGRRVYQLLLKTAKSGARKIW